MYDFADRHIGINNLDKINMLEYVGSKSIKELISETIPENIRLKKEMNLKPALSKNTHREDAHEYHHHPLTPIYT